MKQEKCNSNECDVTILEYSGGLYEDEQLLLLITILIRKKGTIFLLFKFKLKIDYFTNYFILLLREITLRIIFISL